MHPILAGNLGRPSFLGDITLNNAGQQRVCFTFPAPKAGQLEEIAVRIGNITNNQTLKASFQDRSSGNNYPDDVVDQFKTHTPVINSTNIIGPITSDGTSGGTRRTVAKNEWVCLVIEWNSTQGSLALRIRTGTDQQIKGAFVLIKGAGAWTNTDNAAQAFPVFGVRYVGDTDYTAILGVQPAATDSVTTSITSASTPDEAGLSFVAPYDGAKLAGVFGFVGVGQTNNSAFDLVLYDASDVELQSTRFTNQNASAFGSPLQAMFDFNRAALVSLVAGQRYRVTFRPTATGNVQITNSDVSTAVQMGGYPEGSAAYWTQRTNLGGWTDTLTRMPFLTLYWADTAITQPPLPPVAPSFRSTVQRAQYGLGGSHRKTIRNLPGAVRCYFLGDIGTTIAAEDINAASGVYNHTPSKSLGCLPEWGPSTFLDGVDDYVDITSGLDAGIVPFALSVVIRPHASGLRASHVLRSGPAGLGGILGITSAGHAFFGRDALTISGGPRLTAEIESLLTGDYDGTRATLYVNGDMVATLPMTISGHGNGRIGAGFSNEFWGDVQAAAIFADDLTASGVAALWDTAEWEDLAADMVDHIPLTVDRGIHSDRPGDNMARTGTASFGLNNSASNSAGLLGYYSPGHVNARPGFDRGAFIRVGLTVSGVTHPQFTGKIKSIKPAPGVWDERTTQVIATDWMDEAASVRLRGLGLSVMENVDYKTTIETLLNAMRNKPHGVDVRAGSETWPIAMEAAKDPKATAQSELKRCVDSEAGLIYVRGDGTLVCEARNTRAGDAVPAHEILDTMQDADPERSTNQIINRVEVTVYPRRVDASPTTLLYSLDQPLEIGNGIESNISLDFRDPNNIATKIGGLDVAEPIPVTDYAINTAADGSGIDVTTEVTLVKTWIPESNAMRLVIQNNYGGAVFFTTLNIYGRGVYNYAPTTLLAEDEDSIDDDGVQEANFTMPYQGSGPVGESVGQLYLAQYAALPTRIRTVRFKLEASYALRLAGLTSDISTRVRVREVVSGVDEEFYINAVKIDWKEAYDIDVTWYLAPADTQTYWIFDTSTFDVDTRFAA